MKTISPVYGPYVINVFSFQRHFKSFSYQLSQSWLHNQSMNVNCDFKGMIKGIGPEIWIFVM